MTHSATGVRRGIVVATALLSGGKVSSIELGDFLGAANIPISENGSVVMGVGAALSLLVGCGLMALLLYRSRHGHDEPPHESNRSHDK